MTGTVSSNHIKQNSTAKNGNTLYLTKPLGVGILSTAQKKKLIKAEHSHIAIDSMCRLNNIGEKLSQLESVTALTDVTGFGLVGHLKEICEGSDLQAQIHFDQIPLLPHVMEYLRQGCSPGGAQRNFDSYGQYLSVLSKDQQAIVCDPQTSGGLLVAVDANHEQAFLDLIKREGMALNPIGKLMPREYSQPLIQIDV